MAEGVLVHVADHVIDPASPWWVVVAAGVPSVVSAGWVLWRWWGERDEKRADRMLTREQSLLRELEAQRTALGREHADLFDRMRAELLRKETRCAELERDRDRGWDLARWWNRKAHEMRHAGLNAQTIVVGLCEREELEVPKWPDMALPHLEEPQ